MHHNICTNILISKSQNSVTVQQNVQNLFSYCFVTTVTRENHTLLLAIDYY